MIAFVFPGQGSQYVGMGQELYREFKTARQVFEEASDTVGCDLAKLCFEDNAGQLDLTVNAQPAILTVSVAALKVLQEETGIQPDFVAGHSLGEYTALVANGALEFKDAVWVVRKRGQFTQEAVPFGVGAMAAVLGLQEAEVEEICKYVSNEKLIVSPANFNAPGQTVIAGHREAVERAADIAKERGARRVVILDVSAPFHCKLMAPAAKRLSEVLDEVTFHDFRVPIVTNFDAQINFNVSNLKHLLVNQVMNPVRWCESVRVLYERGVRSFFEIGPKNVLSGLIKRIVSDVEVYNFEKPNQLDLLRGLSYDGV
ncbi:MAG: malonyl CoA-acyl carrier protein transacylase [Deltaproteobacteria bacterium]|jgi:[acyl-carrier-protein] S-malonyltransferase|nr:MAG: malonyl CoA-acyl carrier protein transacylase [Deltaproteobacteria bacterium]